jgi:hypothetical protein
VWRLGMLVLRRCLASSCMLDSAKLDAASWRVSSASRTVSTSVYCSPHRSRRQEKKAEEL